MFKFLRLLIDHGQDEFWLELTLSCTLVVYIEGDLALC